MLCDPQSLCHHEVHKLAIYWVGKSLAHRIAAEPGHTQKSGDQTVGVMLQSVRAVLGSRTAPLQN